MSLEDKLVTRFMLSFNPPTVTHQEQKIRILWDKKNNRHIPQKYNPPELEEAKQLYIAHLMKNRLPEPLAGPVALMVQWRFLTARKQLDQTWKTTKPDTDNLNKLLKDCMTLAGFWHDDAQVVYEAISKIWVIEDPGIMISIYDLTPKTEKGE